MLYSLFEINIGTWSIQVFRNDTIAGQNPSALPKGPGIYVLMEKLTNYVGQSINVFHRARQQVTRKNSPKLAGGTATVILNRESVLDEELLIHIEFGLLLIHLGSDHTLLSKQTELPTGSKSTRQRALDFFETFSLHFRDLAPHIMGSRSRKNRRAIDGALPYLRMLWADS